MLKFFCYVATFIMSTKIREHVGNSTGERYSDEEYIIAVSEHEPAGTKEVADAVGVARQSADYRLRQLEEEERVRSKKIGNSLAWSVVDDEP
jgi:predicted transcriptional regulator